MATDPAVIAGVALVSGYVASFVRQSSAKGQSVNLQTEWACWGLLVLFFRLRALSRGETPFKSSLTDKLQNGAGSHILMLAVAIVASQLIRIYRDVDWLFPIVSLATYVSSRRWQGALKIPGHRLSLQRQLEGRLRKYAALDYTTLEVIVAIVAVLSTVCLYHSFPHDAPFSKIGYVVFVVCQTGIYALLTDIQNIIDSIAICVFFILTFIQAIVTAGINPSTTDLFLAIFLAVQWASVLALALSISSITSSTVDTFATGSVRSLLEPSRFYSFGAAFAAVAALIQGIACLPPSVRSRRNLLMLIFLPGVGLLYSGSLVSRVSSHGGIASTFAASTEHPVSLLADDAQRKFADMIKRQSPTVNRAISEYQRRYNRSPPPYFDKWYALAKEHEFVLVDEFDTIMAAIEPLWGVPTHELKGRVNNALKDSNGSLLKFEIKDNNITDESIHQSWLTEQISSWFNPDLLALLPDMVLALNGLDEPQVVLPHDMLERALLTAQQSRIRGPKDSKYASRWWETMYDPAMDVGFVDLSRQRTWEEVTLSCPADSASRNKEPDARLADDLFTQFITNVSDSKEICNAPALREQHGLFVSPQHLHLTHTLLPVFSQAKPSTFQDLLYPSPWYVAKYDDEEYMQSEDHDWNRKLNKLHWSGTTAGGYGTAKTWPHLHRQRLVKMIQNENERITLLEESKDRPWQKAETTMAKVSAFFDFKFSAAEQCDEAACAIQAQTFNIPPKDAQDADADESPISADIASLVESYKYRYVLHLDGNAFNSHFYSLLQSQSCPLKQTIFKEWHDDWLIPWLHYVPVSMGADELPETMRYLADDPRGRKLGRDIAFEGRRFARTFLRTTDMRLVFIRILLEYGRVMDEARELLMCCD